MKSLLLLAVATLPVVITGCVPPPPPRHHVAYVEHDVVVRPRARREVVIVEPRPFYGPRADVRYYSDRHGRYYWEHGRRIYVTVY